ncbi:hypothetical protein [Pseudactinotalea sp.]|uniref:hypothetical protein n=1 Tax=Pseudactinotalea sp. TaxID=1926260 RepID=UPI003B3B2C3D
MSHTVTITSLPDETTDDYGYEFGGTHGADCMVGKRCERWACQTMNPEYETERIRHGLEHWWNWDNREWIVHDTDDCALGYAFEYRTEEETFDGLDLGTYPVSIEWEDTWWIEVQNTAGGEGR